MMRAPARRERAIELREAQVVADRQAQAAPGRRRDDHVGAGLDARPTRGNCLPARHVDVEEVHLAVDAPRSARRGRAARTCCGCGRASPRVSGKPPSSSQTPVLAGQRRACAVRIGPTSRARRRRPPAAPRRCASSVILIAAEVGEVLRQTDQARAGRGRLSDQRRGSARGSRRHPRVEVICTAATTRSDMARAGYHGGPRGRREIAP